MRRATLLYNPLSGRKTAQRRQQIESAAAVLQRAGVSVELIPTHAPNSAGAQARDSIARGSDTILACGGDGTLHETLQGVVGAHAALGVIPLGTANALAWNLKLPFDPAASARKLLEWVPRRISAGVIAYTERDGSTHHRYFTVMAGCGPDAALVYELNAKWKSSAGLLGYAAKAALLYLTHHFSRFHIAYTDADSGTTHSLEASSLMAVRITDFGNVLKRLAPGAALEHDDLRLVIWKSNARLSFPLHLTAAYLGYSGNLPGVVFANASAVTCTALPDHPRNRTPRIIRAEADGEHLGRLPVRLSIERAAFTLLMPPPSS